MSSGESLPFADAFNEGAWKNEFETVAAETENKGDIILLSPEVLACPEFAPLIWVDEMSAACYAMARNSYRPLLDLKLRDIDNEFWLFSQRRLNNIAKKLEEYHSKEMQGLTNATEFFFFHILKAAFYLRAIKNVGNKLENILVNPNYSVAGDALKDALKKSGFKKKALLGLTKKDEIADELSPFTDVLGKVAENYYVNAIFREIFTGFAFALEKNFDQAGGHFDRARSVAHQWVVVFDTMHK